MTRAVKDTEGGTLRVGIGRRFSRPGSEEPPAPGAPDGTRVNREARLPRRAPACDPISASECLRSRRPKDRVHARTGSDGARATEKCLARGRAPMEEGTDMGSVRFGASFFVVRLSPHRHPLGTHSAPTGSRVLTPTSIDALRSPSRMERLPVGSHSVEHRAELGRDPAPIIVDRSGPGSLTHSFVSWATLPVLVDGAHLRHHLL